MSKCQFCGKGSAVGNAVSHAKNRTKRLFKPNIHKLKVLINRQSVRVAFCAKCIKRLKRDGHLGVFQQIKYTPAKEKPVIRAKMQEEKKTVKKEKPEKILKTPEKKEKIKPAMSIEDIVGKKS